MASRRPPSTGALRVPIGIHRDAVVLATDVAGCSTLSKDQAAVEGSTGLGDDEWRRRVADLHTAPPFVVLRLWLDRPVRSERARICWDRRPSAPGQCQCA